MLLPIYVFEPLRRSSSGEVLATMSRVDTADWLKSEKTFIGMGRSISEVSPCAGKIPFGVTEGLIIGRFRELCGRVVGKDEDEDPSGSEIWSDGMQVGPANEGSSARIALLRTTGIVIRDCWGSETGTSVVGVRVISSPLCKAGPLLGIEREIGFAIDEI